MQTLTIIPLLVLFAYTKGQADKHGCDKTFEQCASEDPSKCQELTTYKDSYPECLQNHNFDGVCPCTCGLMGPPCNKDPTEEEEEPDYTDNDDGDDNNDDGEPEPPEPADSTCFHGDGLVLSSRGLMKIKDLVDAGDIKVQGLDSQGHLTMTEIQFWIDKQPNKATLFREFHTESGHVISMTPQHLANTVSCKDGHKGAIESKFAHRVTPGECFLVLSEGQLIPSKVIHIESINKTGYYTFIAGTDSVIVDGIAASTFASIENEQLNRMWFNFIKAVLGYMPSAMQKVVHSALANPMLSITMTTYL